jgi:predicted enzyme related to lactoylglutathione lyase
LVLQKVSEPKRVKNRVHLDFRVDDLDIAIACIIELGGSQLSTPTTGGGVIMADPEGNEFCIGAFQRAREGYRVS